jgi:hypothetical protein
MVADRTQFALFGIQNRTFGPYWRTMVRICQDPHVHNEIPFVTALADRVPSEPLLTPRSGPPHKHVRPLSLLPLVALCFFEVSYVNPKP